MELWMVGDMMIGDPFSSSECMEKQDFEMCRVCTSNYKDGCSRTLKECLDKQWKWLEEVKG